MHLTVRQTAVSRALTVSAAVMAFGVATEQSAKAQIACNCVEYARSRVPSLPRGLFSQADKARIINSYTPQAGSVAVHTYNHVSVVTRVWTEKDSKGRSVVKVSLTEANLTRCKITSRSGTPSQLSIVGYFRPR
jgi:hypothetical protein